MAGSDNFTGQNIQDTYQRVLQLSSSLQLADGTGSLVSFLPISTSYALTSSIEVTKEISSSHANNADTASYIAATNIAQPFTNITASGNISASGYVNTDLLQGQNGSITFDESNSAIGLKPGGGDSYRFFNGTFRPNVSSVDLGSSASPNYTWDNLYVNSVSTTHITASGNISSSGTITANKYILPFNKLFKAIDSTGAEQNIINNFANGAITFGDGDSMTQIDGKIVNISSPSLNATGHISASGNISSSGDLFANNLTLIGDLTATSATAQFTNITASGNISSSGVITTAELKGDGSVTGIETSGYLSSSQLYIGDSANYVSASLGNISGSGNISGFTSMSVQYITASRIDVDGDTIKVGGEIFNKTLLLNVKDGFSATNRSSMTSAEFKGGIFTSHITSSGDISASGTITAEHIQTSDDMSVSNGGKLYLDGGGDTYLTTAGLNNNIAFYANDAEHMKLNSGYGIRVTGDISASGDLILNHVTASGDISSSGNVIADQVHTDLIQSTGTSAGLYTSANFKELTIGYHANLNSRLKINSHVTASGNISASGTIIAPEFIGHTFTHNVGYGAGRAFILGGTPGRMYTYAGGDLGTFGLTATEAAAVAIGGTVFVAPYSCSLEQINWSMAIQDGTSATAFPMLSRTVKLPAYAQGSNQFDMRGVIAPDVNNFEQSYDELRSFRVEHTYSGSDNRLLGPGDSLILIYSASIGAKITAHGMATATFRKI